MSAIKAPAINAFSILLDKVLCTSSTDSNQLVKVSRVTYK